MRRILPSLTAVLVTAVVSFSPASAARRSFDDQAGKPAAHLTKHHQGWRQSDCFACHDVGTLSAAHRTRTPAECGACHGFNGAPHEGHAVKINPCGACHGTVEHVAKFKAPDDCVRCHNHPESPAGK